MQRITGVDTFRVIAVIAVIIIHTTPFESAQSAIGQHFDAATILNQISRFAVPLFFVLSGYFWANKFNQDQQAMKVTINMVKRIIVLFIAWSIVYLLPTNIIESFSFGIAGPIKVTYWKLLNTIENPFDLFFQGTKVHLWFLMSLISSLLICGIAFHLRIKNITIIVGIGLFLIGIAGKSYTDTSIGFSTSFNLRNGPFFSLVFFTTGYFIQRNQKTFNHLQTGFVLVILGYVIQFSELYFLNKVYGTSMLQDYVLGTYLLGVGVALIALSPIHILNNQPISSMGQKVLGIFATHYIFIDFLTPFDNVLSGNPIWDLLYVCIVFYMSLTLTNKLSMYRYTKILVQ